MSEASTPKIVVGLGEVLWDMLPAGKMLGGAPANCAYHANAVGGQGVVLSAVGNDPLGHEILKTLDEKGLAPTMLPCWTTIPQARSPWS